MAGYSQFIYSWSYLLAAPGKMFLPSSSDYNIMIWLMYVLPLSSCTWTSEHLHILAICSALHLDWQVDTASCPSLHFPYGCSNVITCNCKARMTNYSAWMGSFETPEGSNIFNWFHTTVNISMSLPYFLNDSRTNIWVTIEPRTYLIDYLSDYF